MPGKEIKGRSKRANYRAGGKARRAMPTRPEMPKRRVGGKGPAAFDPLKSLPRSIRNKGGKK